MEEQRNNPVFLRPRFSIYLDERQEFILEKFEHNLEAEDCRFRIKIVDNHVFIDVSEEDSHFWSPQLHLQVFEDGIDKSLVKGLFGPKPQVWTLFMFVHFFIATTFIGFAIIFYVKNKLGISVFFPIVMLIILPLIWGLLYFLGRLGKSKGKKQMKGLHDFMIKIISKN